LALEIIGRGGIEGKLVQIRFSRRGGKARYFGFRDKNQLYVSQ
jgi:hypothetical protein